MITVTYLGESYECTTAIKGSNYIHLLDSMECIIASFEGVSDFSGFEISGGSWSMPETEKETASQIFAKIRKWFSQFEEKRELPVLESVYVAFTPEVDSLYVISADASTYMLYVTDPERESYSTSRHSQCSYVPNLTAEKPIDRGLVFSNEVKGSTVTIRRIQ